MNINEKDTLQSANSVENKIDSNEIVESILNPENYVMELEAKIEMLKKLCQEIDPYGQMSDKTIADLKSVGITETYDPFSITNQLLLMLEDSIQEHMNLRLKN